MDDPKRYPTPGMDESQQVSSAYDCTGLIPAIPYDGDTNETRELYSVHKTPDALPE